MIISIIWIERIRPLHIVCDAETPFADNGENIAGATAVVVAGCREVGGRIGVDGGPGPFYVAVVVVGGKVGVWKVLDGVAGGPLCVLWGGEC